MNKNNLILAVVITSTALCGCANPPTTLGKVPARNNIVEKHSETKNYNSIDKYSFNQADVEYQTSGGYHKINIGDFLLGEVLDNLKNSEIESGKLIFFKSQCSYDRIFVPNLICDTSYQLSLKYKGDKIVLNETLPKINIGSPRVSEGQFFLAPIGFDFFQEQISPVLKSISKSLAEKLNKF